MNDTIRDELNILAMRVYKLGFPIRRVYLGIAGLVLCSLVANIVMHFIMPTQTLSSIHIPTELLAYFSDSEIEAQDFPPGFIRIFESFEHIGTRILAVFMGIAGVGSAFAAFSKFSEFVRGDRCSEFGPVAGGLVLSTVLLGGCASLFSSTLDTNTPRSIFVQHVESHHFNKAYDSLNAINQGASPAGLYVLAQMSLIEADEEPVNDEKSFITSDIAKKITEPNSGFEGELDALYAIEMAAFGEIKSPLVASQLNSIQDWTGRVDVMTKVSLGLCAGLGLIAFGLVTIRRSIRRRLQRIQMIVGSPQKQGYFEDEGTVDHNMTKQPSQAAAGKSS